MRLARVDSGTKGRALGEQVVLTHDLVERAGSHPYREGCVGCWDSTRG